MKRLFRLAMITAVAVSALSTFGAALSPVSAAPARVSTPALAALMPANVDLYAEINIGKLTDSLTTVSAALGTSGTPATPMTFEQLADQLKIDRTGLENQLSQLLGRPATLSGDVLNWLTAIAIGVPVTDGMLQDPAASKGKTPQLLVAGSVKDEAAADKFIADSLANISKQGLSFPKTSVQLNGETATRYDSPLLKISLIREPGYVLFGLDSVVDNLVTATGSQPTLAADAKFQKTVTLLNTNSNGLTIYASARALTYLVLSSAANAKKASAVMPLATPDAAATMSATAAADLNMPADATPAATAAATRSAADITRITDALKVLNGLAVGIRTVNKSFALDIAVSVNPDAIKAMVSQMGGADMSQLMGMSSGNTSVSGKLVGQVPASAVALFEGHDLTRIYTAVRTILTVLKTQSGIPGISAAQQKQMSGALDGLTKFEKTLKDQFNLDINQDVLAPLAGDFAVYAYLDANDTAMKPKAGQPPIVPALLIDTTDATKARAFADKLAAGLPQVANITPEKTSDGLYTLTTGSGDSATKLAYGVSGNTFLLTTGGALNTVTAAIGGKDTLEGSAIWKNAKALLPPTYSALLYLDVNAFAPYMKNMAAAGGTGSNQMGMNLLQQVESVLIYSAAPDASSAVVTLALTLK